MTMEDADSRLMLAFKEGDEGSFNELLKKYEKPLINFTYRFTFNLAEAEDLAQETFLRVYRAAGRYEPRAKFSTWLFGIAARLCLDYKKKKRRDVMTGARPIGAPESAEEERVVELADKAAVTPEQSAEQSAASAKVKSCLLSLPENQRLAILLKIYEDKSYQEIAKILDTSVPSVESLIFRARQTLKKLLCDLP
ncbi:MAG: RNA polymerase sigma factor [Endomicrobiales bacterium]